MSITVEGILACDAEYRTTGMDDAVVVLTVGVGGGNHKFEAKVRFGKTPADHLRAKAQAALLRRGVPASFNAQGMRWCDDHGEARFIAMFLTYAQVGSHRLTPA